MKFISRMFFLIIIYWIILSLSGCLVPFAKKYSKPFNTLNCSVSVTNFYIDNNANSILNSFDFDTIYSSCYIYW